MTVNGMPAGDYVDVMTSRPMTSLHAAAAVGGAKCQQQPISAQFSQQVLACHIMTHMCLTLM